MGNKSRKKINKNLILNIIAASSILATGYSLIRVLANTEISGEIVETGSSNINNNSNNNSEDDEKKSSEVQLTSEEIDKVIQDLKLSGNIDNILEKLDEIIMRAELSGNDALKEYASNMKTSYELQKQLDSVNSIIESMKKKNPEIAAVDNQVKKILSVSTITSDLKGALSDEALLVLESVSDDDMKTLQELLAEVENLVDLNDVSALTIQQRSLLDILFLKEITEKQMVQGEKLDLANNVLSVAITILESYQRQNYDEEEYNKLTSGTEEFLNAGKKCSSILPEQIVFLDGYFNMTNSPIMYDGHILMALEDLYQYIDGTIEHMYNNATMVIKSPNKTLEIVAGRFIAYLNDKPYNMPVPILSFNNTNYISVESFAEFYDISYRFLPEYDFLILYKNLNQLENPSVPNKLSKE